MQLETSKFFFLLTTAVLRTTAATAHLSPSLYMTPGTCTICLVTLSLWGCRIQPPLSPEMVIMYAYQL